MGKLRGEDLIEQREPCELWRTVNTLRGNRQQRPVILTRAISFTDNPEEIAEELASQYSERSAASSYPLSFQMAKSVA